MHLAKASVIMADAALLCACLDCFSEGASPFVLTIDFERLHRADYIQGGYNMQLGSEVGRASLSDFVGCAQVPPHRHDRSLPRCLKPGAFSLCGSWNPKQPVRFTRVLLGDCRRFGPLAGWRAEAQVQRRLQCQSHTLLRCVPCRSADCDGSRAEEALLLPSCCGAPSALLSRQFFNLDDIVEHTLRKVLCGI